MANKAAIAGSKDRKVKTVRALACFSFLVLAALLCLTFRLNETPNVLANSTSSQAALDAWMNERLTIPSEMLTQKEIGSPDYLTSRTLLITLASDYILPYRFPGNISETSISIARLADPIPFNSGELAAISSVSTELRPLVVSARELSMSADYVMNLRTEFGSSEDPRMSLVLYRIGDYITAQCYLRDLQEAREAAIVYLNLLRHDPEMSIPWYELVNFLDAITILESITTQSDIRKAVGQALTVSRSYALHFHNSLDFPGASNVNRLQNLVNRRAIKELPKTRLELQRLLEFADNQFPELRGSTYPNRSLTQEREISKKVSTLISTPMAGLSRNARAYDSLNSYYFRRPESRLQEKILAKRYDELCEKLLK